MFHIDQTTLIYDSVSANDEIMNLNFIQNNPSN